MEVSSIEPMVCRFISSASLMSRPEASRRKTREDATFLQSLYFHDADFFSTPDSKRDDTGTRGSGFVAHKSQNTARNVTSRFRILAVRQA